MRRISGLIIFIVVTAVLSGGCSSRRVYEMPQHLSQSTSDAININTATAEELEALPHIGLKTAEAIVRYRIENGPFRRIEYLMQIRGISEKRLAELQPFIKT